jgi:hypothetical protein
VSASVAVDLRGRVILPAFSAQALDVSHGHAFGDDAVGRRLRLRDSEEGARVPRWNLPSGEQCASMFGQVSLISGKVNRQSRHFASIWRSMAKSNHQQDGMGARLDSDERSRVCL